jgi:uncharacterized membrane protein YozB (DUF420 family)
MVKPISRIHLNIVLMLGSVWGLSEAALGMGLQRCASLVSGSLMTGVALFFMASCWAVTGRVVGVSILIIIASLFKVFDALLLSLPIRHGAIGNPIFAFFIQGFAFLVMVMIIAEVHKRKRKHQALLGGASALIAVGLFPLVKFVTGIPACTYAGTGIPLSIYFAPLAIALSILTVPLGFWIGERIKTGAFSQKKRRHQKILSRLVSPTVLAVCLAIAALIKQI